MKPIDMIGQRYGRLSVLGLDSERYLSPSGAKPLWTCQCDCGTRLSLTRGDLVTGNTRSCGCLQRELVANRLRRHGHAKRSGETQTYRSWVAMHQRCRNPANKRWVRYGGRGIAVCARWSAFENFLADMGERPTGMTLDRWPDTDGDYAPDNCRWATAIQQRRNRRDYILRQGIILVCLLFLTILFVTTTPAAAADPSICRPYAAALTESVIKYIWNRAYTHCLNTEADDPPPAATWEEAMKIILPQPFPKARPEGPPPGSVPASGPIKVVDPVVPVKADSADKQQAVCIKAGMRTVYLSNGHSWRCRR